MKLAILLCDGASDWPIEALGNKTIFEAAEIPAMDHLAQYGQMGLLESIPPVMHPGSETANLTIMGYNPVTDLTGRGPLEALSSGVELEPHHIALRCNLINIQDGLIIDYSSGHITTEEARELIEILQNTLSEEGIDFFPGVQYRHILRLDGNLYSEDIICTPPHDELDSPYKEFLIKPRNENDEKAVKTAEKLNQLIEESNKVLKEHPINKKREAANLRIASHIWPWGGGKKPSILPFKEKYGLEGGVISAVDLIFGIGIAAGLHPIHVEGATGLPDTNYEGKARAAIDCLREKDYVYVHVEATDEMGHAGDYERKLSALESFDRRIVQPLLDFKNQEAEDLVIAVLPDHPTPVKIKTHTREPVPFVVYRGKTGEKKDRHYSEKAGEAGELGLIKGGEEFMRLLIAEKN